MTHSTKRKLKKSSLSSGTPSSSSTSASPRAGGRQRGTDQPSARRMPDRRTTGSWSCSSRTTRSTASSSRWSWRRAYTSRPGRSPLAVWLHHQPARGHPMWIELLDGQEEFDIRNELVHRLAHLAVARRFGELPYWLQTGLSWHMEEELLGAILLPLPRQVRLGHGAHLLGQGPRPRVQEGQGVGSYFAGLAAWERGSYESDEARQAFGMARFLMEHHREVAAQLLSNLFHLRDEGRQVRRARMGRSRAGARCEGSARRVRARARRGSSPRRRSPSRGASATSRASAEPTSGSARDRRGSRG